VAEQIVEQCRHTGAGHFVAMMNHKEDVERAWDLFGEKVNPVLRKSSLGGAPARAHAGAA
jgi:hypothetical protein